jgi:hypothetical protein
MARNGYEREGCEAIEAVLGATLIEEPDTHVGPAGQPIAWVDYSAIDADGKTHGFEMKRVVEEDFLKIHALINREPFYASTVLTRLWEVVIDAPTNENLDPSRRRTIAPLIRGLGQQLETDLALLEQGGIFETRGADWQTIDEFNAVMRIKARTHGGICMARPPIAGLDEQPGIRLMFSYGYARRGPDAFARRLDAWIHDPDPESRWANVVASTANGDWQHRHAVLLFDFSEPDYHTAAELGASFVPSAPIEVDDPIEVWCVIGPIVLHQNLAGDWTAHDLRLRE